MTKQKLIFVDGFGIISTLPDVHLLQIEALLNRTDILMRGDHDNKLLEVKPKELDFSLNEPILKKSPHSWKEVQKRTQFFRKK